MKNHSQKHKDMVRSILPSKKRKTARQDKQHLHQVQRRRSHQSLHAYRGYEPDVDGLYDELGEDLTDYVTPYSGNYRGKRDWDPIVWERRNADKLNHFEHWAWKITRDLPPQDRYDYIKSILPDNIIGQHALVHLEFLKYDPLDPDRELVPWRYRSPSRLNSAQQVRIEAWKERERLVKEMVDKVHESRRTRLKINELIEDWNAETYNDRIFVPGVGYRTVRRPKNFNFPYMTVHTEYARGKMIKYILRNPEFCRRLFGFFGYKDPTD